MTNGKTHSGLRRGLCLLLALVMLVGCTGLTAFADDGILLDDVVLLEEEAQSLMDDGILLEEEASPSPPGRESGPRGAAGDEAILIEETLPAAAAEGLEAAETYSGAADTAPTVDPEDPDNTGWAELQTAINEAEDGTVITLTQDVYAREGDSHLAIYGKSITLDLAGFNLNRALTEEVSSSGEDCVILVGAHSGLTLINSVPGTVSAVSGGYASYTTGGGIYNMGTLTIPDVGGGEVAIVNNTARYGGGIYNERGATLSIESGRISNNYATDLGGGIYNNGTLTIDGGLITHCAAGGDGGGIYNSGVLDYQSGTISFCAAQYGKGGAVANGAAMNMAGGTFLYNNAGNGGGICNDGSLTLSGSPRITYNIADRDGGGIDFKGELTIAGGNPDITGNLAAGMPNNIYIHNGKLIVITDHIGTHAHIGVTLQANEGQVTSGASANGNNLNIDRTYLGFIGDTYWITMLRTDEGVKELRLLGKKSAYITNKPFIQQPEGIQYIPPEEVDATNWMAAIRDDRYLYEFNQVYSHDANTYQIAKNRVVGNDGAVKSLRYNYAICQEESLKDQMEHGVRLFDIRLNNVHCLTRDFWGSWTWGEEGDGALYITHGKSEKGGTFYCRYDDRDLRLSVIIDWVKDFLTQHPTETIMLSFTAETQEMELYHDRIFEYLRNHLEDLANTINPSTGESFLYKEPDSYNFFAPYTRYPQLGDCRGKVFIMVDEERELDFVGGMIPEPDFAPERQSQPGNNKVQAYYKKQDVQQFLDEKINVPDAVMLPMGGEHLDVYYQISLNSHTELWLAIVINQDSPQQIYREVNPTFFGPGKAFDQRGKYVGWIKMDGITEEYSRYIWQSNFPEGYRQLYSVSVKSGLDPEHVRDAETLYPDQNYTLWRDTEIVFPESLYSVRGVVFQGWKVTDSQGTKIYRSGETLPLTDDLTIEGVWEYQVSDAVFVRFAGSSYNTLVDVGSTVDLSNVDLPMKDGYTLAGWSTQNDAWNAGQAVTANTVDMDTDGNPVMTGADESGNIYKVLTLTPIWEPREAAVVYDAGDHGVEAPAGSTIRMGDTLTLPAAPASDNAKNIFDGWALRKDPEKRFAAGEVYAFNDWTLVSEGDESPQLVFEAAWNSQRYTLLRFDSAGGTLVDAIDAPPGSAIGEPDAPTKVGYTFAGWTGKDGSAVTWPHTVQEDETLYATWTVKTHTISFQTPEDATQLDPITVPYGTPLTEFEDQLPDPTRPHYSFYNWLPQPPETMPDEDLVLEAVWRQNEYTLEFDASGGKWIDDEGNETTSMDYTGNYNEFIGDVPAPRWEGHYFEGWTVEFTYVDGEEIPPEDPDALVDVPSMIPDVSTKYKAKWTEHFWASPEYTWAEDYSSVTATRACIDDDALTETETVNTTAAVTKEPGCTTRGETTYTAEFTNPAFEKRTLTAKNLDALDHNWGEWVVTRPATETEEGEETCTCSRDAEHTMKRLIPAVWDASTADFVIPFNVIEEEAFTGIAATHVEVQPNVESIGPRAFADCPSLRRIHIPDSVGYVDQTALDGCENVIVCGGVSAAYLADLNGFTFVWEND